MLGATLLQEGRGTIQRAPLAVHRIVRGCDARRGRRDRPGRLRPAARAQVRTRRYLTESTAVFWEPHRLYSRTLHCSKFLNYLQPKYLHPKFAQSLGTAGTNHPASLLSLSAIMI